MPARPRRLNLLLAIGLVALAGSACGRRGSLEPPGSTSATYPSVRQGVAVTPRAVPTTGVGVGDRAAAPDTDAVQAGDELNPAAIPPGADGVPVTTSRGGKRGYRIPREPFILDAIL
ncbi:hypothetical protein [Methylobacterium sp. Leaf118]|uniref:hypothetical protein n=1 Tax=Methylobacterium sp. Leaf118 TaxID=2876562 RepID=UPI001E616581|nr:hypothetical protein [Methylobacterium sp. Leaf118]